MLVYILAFVFPLVVVLVVALRGLDALEAVAFFKKRIPLLKLLSSFFFAALAIGIVAG